MATYKGRVIVGTLELDATVTETLAVETDITDHPVERGVNVADHIRLKPCTLTIEFWISNQPPVVSDQLPTGYQTRSGSAFDYLYGLAANGQLVTVTTSQRTWENMGLLRLQPSHTAAEGDALHATLTMKTVRVVDNKTVAVLTRKPSGQKLDKKGKRATADAGATGGKGRSILKRWSDGGAFDIIGIHTTPGSGVAPQ